MMGLRIRIVLTGLRLVLIGPTRIGQCSSSDLGQTTVDEELRSVDEAAFIRCQERYDFRNLFVAAGSAKRRDRGGKAEKAGNVVLGKVRSSPGGSFNNSRAHRIDADVSSL